MALNEQDSPSVGKSKSTPTVNESSPSTGPMSPDTETLPLWIGQPFNPLICSVEDSHAKISASPVNAQGSTEHAPASGLNTSEPFATFDPATCSWRTSQVSCLTLTWDEYSETWPRAGTMRNGQCYQQPNSELRTCETESGLQPTLIAVQWKNVRWSSRKNYHGNLAEWGGKHWPEIIGKHINLDWLEWRMGYPIGWTDLKDSAMPSSRKSPKR